MLISYAVKKDPLLGGTIDLEETISEELDTVDAVVSELLEKRSPILGGTIDLEETISEELDTVDAVVSELLEKKKAKRSPILGGTIDLEETISEELDTVDVVDIPIYDGTMRWDQPPATHVPATSRY